jgi:acetyl esterase/lipase
MGPTRPTSVACAAMGLSSVPSGGAAVRCLGTVTGALLVAATVGCSSDEGADEPAAAPETTAADEVTVESGVEYGTGEVGVPESGNEPLLLDLYEPAGEADGPRPVVVVIHGGGFTSQSRTDPGIVRIAHGLADHGIVAASIDYRLAGQQPVSSPRVAPLRDALPGDDVFTAMTAAADDTLTAIDYLADHADDLGIDIGRLGVVGSSAGAITADHVGYVLDDHGIDGPPIAFVGSLWGGVFVPPPAGGGAGTVGADQLDAGEPALFAVHGDADERVPVALDDELVARAVEQGVPNEYHRIPGGGHGYLRSEFFTRPVEGRQTPFDRLLAFAEATFL